jgi:hypothetical protein
MYRRGDNIQRIPWRNTIIEKANTYLIENWLIHSKNKSSDHSFGPNLTMGNSGLHGSSSPTLL